MPERNWSAERVRANFRLDLFSGICAGAYLGVVVAFLPVVVRRMGGSTLEVAVVVAAPFMGHLLSPIFGYLFAHARPVRVTAATATAARSIFLVGALVATTPLLLALVSVGAWIVSIANLSAYATLMQGIYPDAERASAMGKVRIGVSLASIASATLAGLFIDAVPARAVFAAAALVGIPGGLAFGRIRHEPPSSTPTRRHPLAIARDVWNDRAYRRLLLSFTIFGFGNLMNGALYPILLVDRFDAPNAFVGTLAALQSATAVAAYLAWGRIIDRGSSLRITVYNTALGLVVPLVYLVAPDTPFLLPAAVFAGITTAGGDITFFTNVVQLAPPGRVGDYAVAQGALMGLRGTLAPFAASALLGTLSSSTVMICALGLMAAGVIVMGRAVRALTSPAATTAAAPA